MTLSWRASTTIRPPTAQLLGTFSSNTAHIPINYQPPFHHRLSSGLRTPKSLLQRLQVPIWRIAIAVSQPAKQGHCKCMTVKRIVRCFANSLNLVSNLIEFGQQIQWIYSAISMILPYCHDDIRALNNCCTSQTKVALLSKTNCFAEQINLLCKANRFVLLSKSIYFAFVSAVCLYETSVSQHIIPPPATPSTIVRKQEGCHDFSADKRVGISTIEVKSLRH